MNGGNFQQFQNIPDQPASLLNAIRKAIERLQQIQKKSAFAPSPAMQQAAMQQASQPPQPAPSGMGGGPGGDPMAALLGMMGGGGGAGGGPGGAPPPGGDPLAALLGGGGPGGGQGGPPPGGDPLAALLGGGGPVPGLPGGETGMPGGGGSDKEQIRQIVREELQQALANQSGEAGMASAQPAKATKGKSLKLDNNALYSILDILKTMSEQIIAITRINRQIAEALGLQVSSGELLKGDNRLVEMDNALDNLKKTIEEGEEDQNQKSTGHTKQPTPNADEKEQSNLEQQKAQNLSQQGPPGVEKISTDSRLKTGAVQVPRLHSKTEDQGFIAEKLKLFVKKWGQE